MVTRGNYKINRKGARSALFFTIFRFRCNCGWWRAWCSLQKWCLKPRFHTKDLAIYMAKTWYSACFGSTTVSAGSFHKFHFRLESTYHDTNKSYSFDDSDANLSNKIIEKKSLKL